MDFDQAMASARSGHPVTFVPWMAPNIAVVRSIDRVVLEARLLAPLRYGEVAPYEPTAQERAGAWAKADLTVRGARRLADIGHG